MINTGNPIFLMLLILFCMVSFTPAQTLTSSIKGTIKDDFDRPVASANITVQDELLSVVANTKADDQGFYSLNLPIGKYRLVVESEGLTSTSAVEVSLAVGTEEQVDLKMQPNLEGKAIKRTPAIYPDVAKSSHQEGRVVVGVLVKPDGNVDKVLFLSGNPIFKFASLQAAQKWVFQKSNTGLSGRIVFNYKLSQ